MDVYVNGEPAGTWETATGNTVSTYHEIDVTGIEDLDALEQYFNETGVMPYEMVNGKKVYVTFAKLPQNNTSVSVSAINELISIAGGSVVAGYNTEGMIAKLSKSLVLNAIMRTMFLVIEGNTVEQSIISQLDDVLNPFCISGTSDVPIYVDSNGVAYVLADAVEAVRNELITLGAYSNDTPEGRYVSITAAPTYFVESSTMQFGCALETGSDIRVLVTNASNSDSRYVMFYISENQGSVRYYDRNKSTGTVSTGVTQLSNTVTIDGKTFYYNMSGAFATNAHTIVEGAPSLLARASAGNMVFFTSYLYDTFSIEYSEVTQTSWSNKYSTAVTRDLEIVSSADTIYGTVFQHDETNTTPGPWIIFSKEAFTVKLGGTSHAASRVSIGDIDVYYYEPSEGGVDIIETGLNATLTAKPYYNSDSSSAFVNVNNHQAAVWSAVTTMDLGIAGMHASSGIIAGFGDLTLPLPDVWPDWYAKKKQVATPADDDLYLRSPALPLDVPVDNVFDDGYAGDSDDATDGDLEDILKDAIVNVLPDILDDIIDNTDVTPEDVYPIPVDDTGNTPPAQPPVLNGSSNGLWTMYNPTKAEVNQFGAWLWGDTLIDQIMRQFNSPIDAVIGFHQIYCTPTTGSPKAIKAGYLDSPVSAKEITDQYATIDCGSVFVDEFYGTALDYNHSHVSIYLPFVGIIPLETSVVTGATLQVIYRIDVFTGTCLAQIKVLKQNSDAVMYAFEGNCAVQIPLTASTYCGVVSSIMNLTQSGISLYFGDLKGAVKGALATVGSGISNLTGTKQSGSMGSNAGALGIRKPYLIITRPIAYDATEYSRQYGYPINKTVTLGSLSGYTKVKDIHLSGIPCTDDELELIERLLKEGVIIN